MTILKYYQLVGAPILLISRLVNLLTDCFTSWYCKTSGKFDKLRIAYVAVFAANKYG